ncbi:beta-crystallin B3 isoform X2 [Eleutherodactylus coqui]|uniref:beta-crystallin B3 isoform X2 n=1 Tax=Eleutherodactylus coqui TaxID=57060 RepID=UPI0034627C09
MATKVELSSRTTRSDILNEPKPSRTYVSPLSDASNKSTDISMSSSLIIEDTIRNPSKTVSMLNTGMKPRLSPKPFSREKPPESRKSIGLLSTLSGEVKQHTDVPFQATTSISLSGSTKSIESERVGRRIFTSSPLQASTDGDQTSKPEVFSPIATGRSQTSSIWSPGTNHISESKFTSQTDEKKVTSKPPITSRRPELSQQEKVYPSYSRRSLSDSVDESIEPGEKSLEKTKADNIDSITVRAQLRQKRRPVSAVFLELNEPVSDEKVADEPRKWNRRPLSEDLTSFFEGKGIENKKESPSEETKENRPFKKNALNSSITNEQSNVCAKEGGYASDSIIFSDTKTSLSGISLRNTYSARMEKDKTKEMPSKNHQQIADVGENEGIMKLSANINNQSPKFLPEQYGDSSSEVKKSDEIGIAPGITTRRIGLFIANTSSTEEAEVPSNTEDKSTANSERKTRLLVSDRERKPETEWSTSPSPTVTTDFTKKFLNSPSRLDLKSEKPIEERRSSFSSQSYTAQKDKKEWQNTSLVEEKTFRPRRSIRRNDDPLQLEGSAEAPTDRKDYGCKEKLYDAKTNASEENNNNSTQVQKVVKTVKATMFEHNVEKHNPPEVYHSGDLVSNQPPVVSECLLPKREANWFKWLSGDNVQSVSQIQRDPEITDFKFSEKSVGMISSSTEVGSVQRMILPNIRKVDENSRVEPRYEVVQAIGEKVLSESIEMAPEDKAVTLRSRRSFHSKDRELGKDGEERLGTSLQRSKSEYRKRNALNSPQENSQVKFFSRETDFPFERKTVVRTQKNELIDTPPERFYKDRGFSSKDKTSNDETDFDIKEKSHESKEKLENTLGKYSSEYLHFGTSGTGKKEMKTSFRSFNQQSDTLIRSDNSVEKDSEKDIKTMKDNPTIANSNVRDKTNYLSQMKEYKNQSSLNQCPPQKGLPTKNLNKEQSNDLTNVMFNTESEQLKKELFTRQSSTEADSFQKPDYKEENKEDTRLLKTKDSFQRGERNRDNMRRTSDLHIFDHDDIRRKSTEFRFLSEKKDNMDVSSAKDSSPVDKKATYFAVTGMDGKKQRSDDVANQTSSNTTLTSEECYAKHSMKMGITNSSSHFDSFPHEEKSAEKDTDTSHASKEFKTYKNVQVQDTLKERSEKASERRNVIDIDALLRRHKQKSSTDDKSSSYLETQIKPIRPHLIEPENTQEANSKGSPLKLDGTYKSKVLDIDSLMADYTASQRKDRENKARDDDHNLTKWERSRSFSDNVSKISSSKWKDPSIRHSTNDEGYKREAIASRYASPQETTSKKDDLRQGLSKRPTLLDHLNSSAEGSHAKDPYKEREVQGILEYSVRTFNHKSQSTQFFDSTTIETQSTSRGQGKLMLKGTNNDQSENQVVERQHQTPPHRGFSPEEKTQPLSVGKKAAKASDLISLMLENKEKGMERHRSRQNVPVEPPPEPKTRRLVTQQEWLHSESKEFHKKEELKQPAARIQEMAIASDLSRRKGLNRHREYTISSNEDHVKQCFSRSSTSNKDTDSLVQETDRQYGTWGQDKQKPEDSFVQESTSYDNISSRKQQSHSRLSSLSHTETDQHDSVIEARDGSLDRSSMDLDSTDGTASTPSFHEAKAVDFSFMDQTSVLDSTALKNRVQLSRKSQRRAPSQTQRRSRLLLSSSQLAVIEDTDSPWMFTDSTEDKPDKKDEVDEEEEKPQRSSVQSQRMPMFPGMDPSTLMAQLRKRQEAESSSESSTQPSSPQASAQPSRSPKSPLPQGTLGVKLLPTSADIQDRGASESPQWLKELKSKKRQSQYENQS